MENNNKPFAGNKGLIAVGMLVVLVLLAMKMGAFNVGQALTGKSGTQATTQAAAKTENGTQVATITVSSSGYGPENVILKAGEPAKINFKTQDGAGCVRQVQSESLGINAILDPGDNFITLQGLKPGTYQYACGMGMYGGTITVK